MKIALIGDSLTEGRPGVSFSKMLKDKYPQFQFDNLGKPGESIKSLHSRLSKTKLDTDYDIAFLWIGVNDVYSKLLKVQAQPVAEDHQIFNEYFSKVLDMVIPNSIRVIAVSPAIVGEDIKNPSNSELRELSSIIETVSHKHTKVSFLNMQSVFERHLSNVSSSKYVSTGVLTVIKDVLFYKNPKRIDQLSKKRGLHFTLDGIHLNSHGASIVTEEFSKIIDQFSSNDNKIAEK